MGKNIKNRNFRQKSKVQTPAKLKKQTTSAGGDLFIWIVKNIGAVIAAGFFLFQCVDKQQSYHWAYNSLLKGNMATIRKYPNATLDERAEMKLGFDYTYLQFLKKETPEDAVILYPDGKDFFPEGEESPFKQDVSNKMWALRFLYPRKLVLPSEMETNCYAKDITHVAIVNGRGYERVEYKIANPFTHGVLPIKH
jgi:hypothetical protein